MAKQQGSDGLLWFVAGVSLGATIALLYAPASGHHTRKRIKKVAGTVAKTSAEKVAESGRQISELGRELYERGRQMADDANTMFERGRKLIDDPQLGSELGEES
jgi:gas vesicle protein